MFGFRYLSTHPHEYVCLYRQGRLIREGQGISGWYYRPGTQVLRLPLSGHSLLVSATEFSQDYQTFYISGELGYRIVSPRSLLEQVDTPETKIMEALEHQLQLELGRLIALFINARPLEELLHQKSRLESFLLLHLADSAFLQLFGIGIQYLVIERFDPCPEVQQALRAKTWESLCQEKEQAYYARKLYAAGKKEEIRRRELQAELAVEEQKKRLVQHKIQTELLKRGLDRAKFHQKMQRETDWQESVIQPLK